MNLKNQNIEFFELYVNDNLLLEGENIHDNQKDIPIYRVDKGLWVAQFINLGIAEVEVVVTKTKIINYNCPCEGFDQKGICGHVIATLFALRSKLQTEAPKKRQTTSIARSNLSVHQILEKVSSKELHIFLRNYAAKDKRFNLLIKAHFAREILGASSIDEYKSIAESLLKPISQKNQKITPGSIRILQSVGDEFLAQFEDALSMELNNEAFYLLLAILPKIAYAKYFITKENSVLNKLWDSAHRSLEKLLNNDIAPELKRDIVYEVLDVVQKSYYKIYDLGQNILEILYQNELEYNVTSDIVKIVLSKLGFNFRETPSDYYYAAFLVRSGININKVFGNIEIKHNIKIADTLIALKSYPIAQNLLKACLDGKINPHYERAVKSKLLQLYKFQKNDNAYFSLAIKSVLDKFNKDLFKEIISNQNYQKTLYQAISSMDNSDAKHKLILHYYAFSDDMKNLNNYIYKFGTLEQLKKYDQQLYVLYPRKIEQRYETLIKSELEDLLGFQASKLVQDLGIYWDIADLKSLKKYIWAMLKKEYGHRKKLLNSI